jgi:hypothetical protein
VAAQHLAGADFVVAVQFAFAGGAADSEQILPFVGRRYWRDGINLPPKNPTQCFFFDETSGSRIQSGRSAPDSDAGFPRLESSRFFLPRASAGGWCIQSGSESGAPS